METFTTEIAGSQFTCHSLGVVESVGLDGKVTDILGRALKASSGLDIRQAFGGEGEVSDQEVGAQLFENIPAAIGRFRDFLDWDEFTEFMFECIGYCFIIQEGDPVSLKNPELLDVRSLQHYKVFGWYLECQLGPFIEWLAPLITSLLKDEPKKSGKPAE